MMSWKKLNHVVTISYLSWFAGAWCICVANIFHIGLFLLLGPRYKINTGRGIRWKKTWRYICENEVSTRCSGRCSKMQNVWKEWSNQRKAPLWEDGTWKNMDLQHLLPAPWGVGTYELQVRGTVNHRPGSERPQINVHDVARIVHSFQKNTRKCLRAVSAELGISFSTIRYGLLGNLKMFCRTGVLCNNSRWKIIPCNWIVHRLFIGNPTITLDIYKDLSAITNASFTSMQSSTSIMHETGAYWIPVLSNR